MDLVPNRYSVDILSAPDPALGGTSKRLYGPDQPALTPATIYTTPGSTRTRLSYFRVVNTTAAAATLTISIGVDGVATRIFDQAIDANSVWGEFVDFTLEPTEVLQAGQTVSGSPAVEALTLTINGAEQSI
jgi:hypothetical protein